MDVCKQRGHTVVYVRGNCVQVARKILALFELLKFRLANYCVVLVDARLVLCVY